MCFQPIYHIDIILIMLYIQDIDKWYKKCDIIAGQN